MQLGLKVTHDAEVVVVFKVALQRPMDHHHLEGELCVYGEGV